MTKDEAVDQVTQQDYCTIEQYEAIHGRPYTGTDITWFAPFRKGYKIKPHKPTHAISATGLQKGRPVNPDSEAQQQPWIEQGISQATYYRRKAADTKWSMIFVAFNARDTRQNREVYTRLARAAVILGVPVAQLWREYQATIMVDPPALGG